MSLTILNDWHIGAIRSGGTTPTTAYQLRLDLLVQFEETLAGIDTDLMILGDLFDGPDVSKLDLLRTYHLLSDWLVRTGKSLWLIPGNHDISKSTMNYSSFQFLGALLNVEGAYAGTVHYITEGTMTPYGYVIPHVVNQDVFDLELAKVPKCDYLFLHCNYDNKFAVEADHSLNLSREQAEALPVRQAVLAHEHQGRDELNGKVLVIGNQRPSSVADCLGNEVKHMLRLEKIPAKHPNNLTEPRRDVYVSRLHQTWQAEGDYSEQDWRDLADAGRFIRVTGTATAAEAANVASVISRFRSSAKALVISNAVKIEGVDDQADLAMSHAEITAFNVRDALRELLTDDENKKIDKLLEAHNA